MKQVGDYVLDKPIGRGSFGQVFKGRNLRTDKTVAIKMLSTSSSQYLESNFDKMTQISHPNLVKVLNMMRTINHSYIVFEYCEAGDLSSFLKNHHRVDAETCRRWTGEVLNCLRFLEEREIIHRDVKPENIMLKCIEGLPIAKLTDFGLARILEETGTARTQVGTPLFMAPEVLKGEAYTFKADVWSLGVVVYQMMTGKLPFPGRNIYELMQAQQRGVCWPADISLDPEAIDFVNLALTYKARIRPNFSELMNHVYYYYCQAPEEQLEYSAILRKNFESLRTT